MGAVSQVLAKHGVEVRRGRVDIHKDQGVVECFSRTLAERLFGHQYAQEMRLPEDARSTEWVKRLPAVVATLNGEDTRLTGKKPRDAITAGRAGSPPYLLTDLLDYRSKSSLQVLAFAICSSRAI